MCKDIETKSGKGKIYSLGSKNSNLDIPRWSTYIEDLDYITGGGLPKGRIIEISGPESSGKTSLALHLTSLHPLALYIPAEGTFDSDRAKVFGNRKKQLLVYNCDYGEDALEKTLAFTKQGIPIIVIDSIPFLCPKEEYDAVEKDMEKNLRIGGIARLLTKTIPTISKAAEKSGTTIIFINQVRDKMDAMMFGEKTQTPGGHAFKHACSIRMQVARRDWIQIPNKDPRSSSDQEKVGIITRVKINKSKVCPPFKEAELPMYFDRGYVSHDDMKTIRKELMGIGKKKKSKGEEEDDDE